MAILVSTAVSWLQWGYNHVVQELGLKALCVYAAILLLSWLVRRLVILPAMSPLQKIPGRPWSLRNLVFGNMLEIIRSESIDLYARWVQEMGTGVIRYHFLLGKQRVLIADADAMKEILVTKAAHFPRPELTRNLLRNILGDSLLSLEGEEHKVQRKLCNAGFTQASIQRMVPIFQKHADQLCSKWNAKVKATKDGPTVVSAQDELHSLAFDIISEAGFSHQTNSQMHPNDETLEAFTRVTQADRSRFMQIVMPTIYRRLPLKSNRILQASRKFIYSIIRNIIHKKREMMQTERAASRDLLGQLMAGGDGDDGAQLSSQLLQDHVMTFMTAGHETTSSSLAWILLTLARRPDIQTKLRQEVQSCVTSASQPITMDDLDHMTYLNCVVKEGMRLLPSVPVVLRKAKCDTSVNAYFIPKGTTVTLAMGALHRNPAYWESPEEFRPERFANDNVPFYAYQPFLSGPHMCIGYRFALIEIKITLAVLIRAFEFSPLPNASYRKKQSITMRPFPKLQLHVRCIA